jgi:hypothetical protein
MKRHALVVVVAVCTLVVQTRFASAEDIRGTIVRTLILSESSRLVGDVTVR